MLETSSPESNNGSEFGWLTAISKPEGTSRDVAGGGDFGILTTTDTLVAVAGVLEISVSAKISSVEKFFGPSGADA
jgi:hypothetical protein